MHQRLWSQNFIEGSSICSQKMEYNDQQNDPSFEVQKISSLHPSMSESNCILIHRAYFFAIRELFRSFQIVEHPVTIKFKDSKGRESFKALQQSEATIEITFCQMEV
uniref:Uncharacterized protein n=1 Tax=Cucumis sativus TaxID=3659 RepID=A0A0A0L0F2_CUCSA